MQVQIIKDYDHWISPTITQAFRAETVVNVPRKTAQALIKADAAIKFTPAKED